jgi:hypothetical protein
MASGEKKKKSRAKKVKKAVLTPTPNSQSVSSSIKKNTSLRLEQATLKKLKIRAIEEDTSVQQLLEMLVTDYLNSGK